MSPLKQVSPTFHIRPEQLFLVLAKLFSLWPLYLRVVQRPTNYCLRTLLLAERCWLGMRCLSRFQHFWHYFSASISAPPFFYAAAA